MPLSEVDTRKVGVIYSTWCIEIINVSVVSSLLTRRTQYSTMRAWTPPPTSLPAPPPPLSLSRRCARTTALIRGTERAHAPSTGSARGATTTSFMGPKPPSRLLPQPRPCCPATTTTRSTSLRFPRTASGSRVSRNGTNTGSMFSPA